MGPRAAAGLSLLLAAAAGGMLWLSSHPGDDADAIAGPGQPGASSTAKASRPPAPTDVTCPSSKAQPDGPSDLADDPVLVRLCPGPGAFAPTMPRDVLTHRAAEVAAAIRDEHTVPAPDVCSDDAGVAYILAFAYRDGSVAYATGYLYGCRNVVVGDTYYADPQSPLDTFGTLLWKQRRDDSPPRDVRPPRGCSRDQTDSVNQQDSLIADPSQMTEARFCLADGSGRGTTMTADQVRAVVRDWTTGGSGKAPQPYSCGDEVDWQLEGVTAWGDPVRLGSVCGLYRDDDGTYHHPGSSVASLLAHLEIRAA